LAGGRSSVLAAESNYVSSKAAYRQAIPAPFTMPQRPLIRVTFLDFYDMAVGPTYLETEVAVLGMNGDQPGWVVLTLPVTSGPACIGGRSLFGLSKVMRRITLERSANRFVGTQYARGATKPEITLTVDIGDPDKGAPELLRQYGVYPQFGLLQGRVVRFAGSGTSFSGSRPGDYQIAWKRASIRETACCNARCRRAARRALVADTRALPIQDAVSATPLLAPTSCFFDFAAFSVPAARSPGRTWALSTSARRLRSSIEPRHHAVGIVQEDLLTAAPAPCASKGTLSS
jgi:hypothetical protein